MKISEETIQNLRNALNSYISESGESIGKYLFSKEIGIIENKLYSEASCISANIGHFDYPQELNGDKVEGELPVVDDAAELLPIPDAV